MQFQVTDIDFDFDEDYGDVTEEELKLGEQYKQRIFDQTVNQLWEVDDENDLVDQITDSVGWCIRSIEYNQVSNTL